jgi:ABC-type dipeptide/oligopeptide/nickel transport system permease subunit
MLVGGVLVFTVCVIGASAPLIAPYHYDHPDFTRSWEGPSRQYLLGTDALGRDLFSRILYGTRISLFVSITATGLELILGASFGAVSGYLGGTPDLVAMRVVDILLAFPSLLFMIMLSVAMGGGIVTMIVAIFLTRWAPLARLVRGEFLRLKGTDFVLGAIALGAPALRVALRHVLPNSLPAIIVFATFEVPFAIVAEASLGFIGLGVSPPTPSWGVLLNDGFRGFRSFPLAVLGPSTALGLTMFGFILLGNGLRARLDPRLRN